MGDAYGELEEDLRGIDQRLASLKQDAQQLRLAMETDIKARHEDSQAHGGRRYCSSNEAWGLLFCKKGPSRPETFDQFRRES